MKTRSWATKHWVLWLEISIKNKIQLKRTFYRTPNSTNVILSTTEDSIGLAFETNISNYLITGDFNLNIPKITQPKSNWFMLAI